MTNVERSTSNSAHKVLHIRKLFGLFELYDGTGCMVAVALPLYLAESSH